MKTQPISLPTTRRRHSEASTPPMPVRVAIKPALLRWARERASLEIADLIKIFPKIEEWETGEISPTVKQLQEFAEKTHVPHGYLYLSKPPDEPFPTNDFRTFGKGQKRRPSPNLLDTIYTMQRRSLYLRDEHIYRGIDPIPLVGSATLRDNPKKVAHNMREALGFADGWGSEFRSWRKAIEGLRGAIEKIGIMAVINGVVGNKTSRKLDKDEFLGLAICDEYAPLIFVNGMNYESGIMFTLAHELAHIWLGAAGEGVSLTQIDDLAPSHKVEEFCSKVAMEFLVPAQELRNHWKQAKNTDAPYEILAEIFKISPVIAARRALDERLITRRAFLQFCDGRTKRWHRQKKNLKIGDFYKMQNVRVGPMFAKAMFYAAKEGRIGYMDAYRLTTLRREAFHAYIQHLGVDS